MKLYGYARLLRPLRPLADRLSGTGLGQGVRRGIMWLVSGILVICRLEPVMYTGDGGSYIIGPGRAGRRPDGVRRRQAAVL